MAEVIYGIMEGNRLKTVNIEEDGAISTGEDILLSPGDYQVLGGEIEIAGKKYMEIKLTSSIHSLAYGIRSQVPPCQQMVMQQIDGETNFVPIIIS